MRTTAVLLIGGKPRNKLFYGVGQCSLHDCPEARTKLACVREYLAFFCLLKVTGALHVA